MCGDIKHFALTTLKGSMILYREESLGFHGELAKSVILVPLLLVAEVLYHHLIVSIQKLQNHCSSKRA